jgi:hypothetical protein
MMGSSSGMPVARPGRPELSSTSKTFTARKYEQKNRKRSSQPVMLAVIHARMNRAAAAGE